MKNKKGFTLIEIIICVVLLALIGTGTAVTVVTINSKKESEILEKYKEDFETALNVYLSKHNNVITNLYNNVEGAVITL